MYHYDCSGLDYIYLENGYEEFDDGIAIHDMDGLHKAISKLVVDRPVMKGREFRFLRIEMNLSQIDIAKLFGVSESTVRNWEANRTELSGPAANLMRGYYLQSIDESSNLGEMIVFGVRACFADFTIFENHRVNALPYSFLELNRIR